LVTSQGTEDEVSVGSFLEGIGEMNKTEMDEAITRILEPMQEVVFTVRLLGGKTLQFTGYISELDEIQDAPDERGPMQGVQKAIRHELKLVGQIKKEKP
jgi:hypothetical protein